MKKVFFLILFFYVQVNALESFDSRVIKNIKNKYGSRAYKRLTVWDKMLIKAKNAKTLNKLKYVNDFFNKVKYMTDIKHWHKVDYWATPYEFVGTGAGDCEDYAIAKYFALIKLGIPENKLRISYVKLLRQRTRFEEAHMVLAYYHKPNSTPIILDNVNKRLKLVSQRKDLKLIYSFNANGLYQSKTRGQGQVKVGSNNLHKWKNLVDKL
jgi:predicted transglutaminase-like cysteine proteinase